MKTREKVGNDFKKDLHYQSNFSFFEKDFRIKQVQNQNFVVPWQMVEKGKKENVVN